MSGTFQVGVGYLGWALAAAIASVGWITKPGSVNPVAPTVHHQVLQEEPVCHCTSELRRLVDCQELTGKLKLEITSYFWVALGLGVLCGVLALALFCCWLGSFRPRHTLTSHSSSSASPQSPPLPALEDSVVYRPRPSTLTAEQRRLILGR
jgi:hypothetical protein